MVFGSSEYCFCLPQIFRPLIRCDVRPESGTLGAVCSCRRPVRPQWHPPPSTGDKCQRMRCDPTRILLGSPHTSVMNVLGEGGVETDDIRALLVACEDTTQLRERRLQSERFEITFEATFADTSTANTSLTQSQRSRRHSISRCRWHSVMWRSHQQTTGDADTLRNCSKRCSFVNVHNVVHESLKKSWGSKVATYVWVFL